MSTQQSSVSGALRVTTRHMCQGCACTGSGSCGSRSRATDLFMRHISRFALHWFMIRMYASCGTATPKGAH